MKPRKIKEFKGALGMLREFPSEQACRDFFEQIRWNGKIECPHCKITGRVAKFKDGRLYFCGACRKQFTVKVGTIFEDSALSLQKWFYAVYMLTAHKKGISSVQLSKDIGVTQKTAWFMCHRIRFALANNKEKMLDGIVEVDETYIGGEERNKHLDKQSKVGGGVGGKAPVFGMLDRDDGIVITKPIQRANARTLKGMMKSYIHASSTIMSDEASPYRKTLLHFDGHDTVDHGRKEYVRGDVHTNTLDGFWSLLKRGIIGIYHKVSVDHLHRYCTEFSYRYNSRKMNDRERFEKAMSNFKGRLMYKNLITE